MSKKGQKIATVITEVHDELVRAMEIYPKFASLHEGYAVLLEEVDEFWVNVKANDSEEAMQKLKQVAAMAMRCIVDCCTL